MDFNKTLETKNVLLRPIIKDDFNDYQNFTRDKNMWYYFTSDLSDETELKNWIDAAVKQQEEKIRLPFSIVEKTTGKAIGSTSFLNISARDMRVEIGATWIAKEYQGKGINDQVKYMMMEYCFDELDYVRAEFKTDVLNIPARKALTRIGAVEEGVLRSHTLMINNRRRDTIYYSVLKDEWAKLKTKNLPVR